MNTVFVLRIVVSILSDNLRVFILRMDLIVDIEGRKERRFLVRFGEKFSLLVPLFDVGDCEQEGTFTFVIRRIGEDFFLAWRDSDHNEVIESHSPTKQVGNEIHHPIEIDDFFEINFFETVVGFRCKLKEQNSDDDGVDTQSEMSSSSLSHSD